MDAAIVAICWLSAAFILGTWWGLYLNLTHSYRMQLWANRVADLHQKVRDA